MRGEYNLPVLTLVTLIACTAAAQTPDDALPLGALFAGGVLDLMTEPRRDLTPSFAALIAAPLGDPLAGRAAEFSLLHLALPPAARTLNRELTADTPALVGICARPEDATTTNIEALLRGRTRAWRMLIKAKASTEHATSFFFIEVMALEETLDRRLQSGLCKALARDAAGEVFFDGEKKPVRFETAYGEAWPSGSDHLLDFLDDQDRAVGGLIPPEVYVSQHTSLPRPRAAAVLSLVSAAEAFWVVLNTLTVVATPPVPTPDTAVFLARDKNAVRVSFKNGSFVNPQLVSPAVALPGQWSKWTWSLIEPRMPAQTLLDLTPAAASCLDALPKVPDEELSTKVQRCFDLSLPDAGPAFRVRRERWLEAVRQHELAAASRVESFCADQTVLAALPIFQHPPAGKKRDAGPLLNGVLGWEDRGPKKFSGSMKLSLTLEERFSSRGFMEVSERDLAMFRSTDTSFFSKLSNFDRWELTLGKGPLTAASPSNAAQAPLPKFNRLTLAARLHLRRASKGGKLVQAAGEVRHAARLAFTVESLVAQITALRLLTLEWRAWEWAQKNGLPTSGWAPIDEETVERAFRVVFTAPGFFSPMTNEETFARAVACDQVTSCSSYTEVVAVSSGLESLLRAPWSTRYGAVLAAITKPNGRCSFNLARYWSTRPLIDVAEAKGSRHHEVIAGGIMSHAAKAMYVPAFEKYYPNH